MGKKLGSDWILTAMTRAEGFLKLLDKQNFNAATAAVVDRGFCRKEAVVRLDRGLRVMQGSLSPSFSWHSVPLKPANGWG